MYPEDRAYKTWEKDGLTFSLVMHASMGHNLGYVRFPERPVREPGYHGIIGVVPVHGGVTYAEEDEKGMVYGFDCYHGGDETRPECFDEEWLMAEAEHMARAIWVAAKYEDAWLEADDPEGRTEVWEQYYADLREEHGIDPDNVLAKDVDADLARFLATLLSIMRGDE